MRNITGGGLEDNIKRILPENYCAKIDLKKVKTRNIFKWLYSKGIGNNEMLKILNLVRFLYYN